MLFDIAIDGNRAFRFEHGPGATALVSPDDAPDLRGPVLDRDGREVKQVQAAQFESVLGAEVWRLAGEPERLDLDPLDGHLGDDPLVLVRELPELPHAWPQYPSLPPGDPMPRGHGSVLDRVEAEITALAPEGWQRLTVECRAVARRMEVEAAVVLDGVPRAWSPPVLVSQWLHRLRVREYRNSLGAWYTARFEFVAGGETTRRFSVEGRPGWRVPPGHADEVQHYADELRLLPRRPEAVPDWMWHAAGSVQQRGRAHALDAAEPEPVTEVVRAFDAVEDGRGVWYRPMVGGRERELLLRYLESAPVVLSSRGAARDLLSDSDERVVPLGHHTDGRYVWSAAVVHYLREHQVPPAPALVDHIRQNRYRLPEVPEAAKARAAALAMGRPYDEDRAEAAFREALAPLVDVIVRCQTSPRFYSLGSHRDQAWCLVRDGDWYEVYRADGDLKEKRVRFGDVRDAVAHLTGRLVLDQDALRYELDEELPAWQAPYQVISEQDPPLHRLDGIRLTGVTDLVVHRYGSPDGNLVHAEEVPSDLEFHRYLLKGSWNVVTAVTPAGDRVYVLPQAVREHVAAGHADDLTRHPGLPPVTDALREQARRNPGGWVWCADPDVDPRYVEGTPTATLLGAYESGPDGVLTGKTFLNPDYRPGPRRSGFPEPLSEFDLVLGYVAVGWLPRERVLRALLDSPLVLETDGSGGLRVGVDQSGRRFIAAWSAPGHVPAGTGSPMQTTGRELLPALAGVTLVVNPGGELGIELPGDDLIAAASG
ncbi:hypothetical protein ACFV4N_14295 [Actinosynnema sp. NPDC059797]